MEPIDRFLSKMTDIFGTREKINEVLFICIQHLIIRPRCHLLALLSVLRDKLIINKVDKDTADAFLEDTRRWIMSTRNKKFTEKYYIQNNNSIAIKMPEIIAELYLRYFNENIETAINKYIQPGDNETVGQYIDAYIQDWRNPVAPMTAVVSKNIHVAEDPNAPMFRRGRNEAGRVGGTTELVMEDGGNVKTFEKLNRVQEKINLHYKKGIREIKKADSERFAKIFEEFGITDPSIKVIIPRIWYGDINSENVEDNNILNVVKKKKIKIKISNYNIRSSTNRLILQTYVVGLIIGKSIYEIFTVINRIDSDVTPAIIHNKGRPNPKIQEILNNIISEIYLDPSTIEINLRNNWEKIKNPKVNPDKLIEYIERTKDIHDKNKYLIISRINDLDKKTSIEKYTKEVHDIIKDISLKNITEANISTNLRYY